MKEVKLIFYSYCLFAWLLVRKLIERSSIYLNKETHGWRKFWNIQARRTETDLSGKPLWGLHSWSFLFNCCRAHCFWMNEVSRDHSFSSSEHKLLKSGPMARMQLLILSLKSLYKREMVWSAKCACMCGSNSVAAWNADTTVWTSSKHWLYPLST